MSAGDVPEGAPRIHVECRVIKAEHLRTGMWFFPEAGDQVPVRALTVTHERDRHGKKVRVPANNGKIYTFRPDSDDEVEIVV